MCGAQQCFVFAAGRKVAGCSGTSTRRDTFEMALELLPLLQNTLRMFAASFASMQLDDGVQSLPLFSIVNVLYFHQFGIAAPLESPCCIQHVGHTGRHTCAEVLAGLTQHYYHTTGHILTAMITHALNNRQRSTVTYGKALACPPGCED